MLRNGFQVSLLALSAQLKEILDRKDIFQEIFKMKHKNSCPQGYTSDDIRNLFGPREQDFYKFMRGQTMSVCDGRSYDYETKSYVDTICAGNPHGPVIYAWDVQRFIEGSPIID